MVEIGGKYTLEVTGMTHDGCGIGSLFGLKVFVNGVFPGEVVEAEVTKVTDDYLAAKPLNIVKKAVERVEPFCGHFILCGGCSLQNIEYSEQLKLKAGIVRDALKRVGGIDCDIVNNTIGMQYPRNYRNRVNYPVGIIDSQPVVGFFSSRSNVVVGIDKCDVQHSISDFVKQAIRQYICEQCISIYDRVRGEGLLRHIVTRVGFRTGEVMVVLVINGEEIPDPQSFISYLVDLVPQVKSIYVNINRENTNMVMGSECRLMYGSPTITDYIGKYKFEVSPLSFFQVNPIQTEVLYNTIFEYAGLTGQEAVYDLYCGSGTISLYLSGKAKKVIGIEAVEEAVASAKRNAQINGLDNVEFIACRVENVLPDVINCRGKQVDVVILDPPRKGCKQKVLDTILAVEPRKIIYVSCNPSTMARDLKIILQNGYRVVEVQPVDMFPHTAHVECVIMMTYCGSDDK
ncbi:MAG: 23S rRNA (uracil(1939)-C(5))-methyltransferase RlmD [Clostridia bacterium]|nr:23S rRNA (uracil(1939)-C(5))-methyltransferase RlmD [Clostridia bacterium]